MRVRSAPAFGVVTLSKAEDFWADSQGYLLPLLTLFVGNFLLHHFWCIGTASIVSLLVVLGVVGALALAGTAVIACHFRLVPEGGHVGGMV